MKLSIGYLRIKIRKQWGGEYLYIGKTGSQSDLCAFLKSFAMPCIPLLKRTSAVVQLTLKDAHFCE